MEYKTIAAAEALLASGNRDTWALADAVLEDIPERSRGGNRFGASTRKDQTTAQAVVDLQDCLEQIVETLNDLGITTPNGEEYSTTYLAYMRSTAISWPKNERHDEAAFRTHQEAGGRDSRGRVLLASLCKVAAGKRTSCPKMPDGTPTEDQIDPAAWNAAAQSIRDKRNRARPPRFLVTANALRVAMQRKPNTPPPEDLQGLLTILLDVESRLRNFALKFSEVEASDEWTDDLQTAMGASLDRVVGSASMARDVILGRPLDDDELAALLEQETSEEGQ